jgi:hypothetical protein
MDSLLYDPIEEATSSQIRPIYKITCSPATRPTQYWISTVSTPEQCLETWKFNKCNNGIQVFNFTYTLIYISIIIWCTTKVGYIYLQVIPTMMSIMKFKSIAILNILTLTWANQYSIFWTDHDTAQKQTLLFQSSRSNLNTNGNSKVIKLTEVKSMFICYRNEQDFHN